MRRIVDEVLEFFGGSARPLMAHLIESGKLTLDDVRELEGRLGAIEGGEPAPEGDPPATTRRRKR